MDKEHASNAAIARGAIMPMHPEEDGEAVAPQMSELFLDTDGKFRWYEEGEATNAAGATLRTAIESARLKWPQFEIVELKGRVVEWQNESDFPEIYAADELEKRKKAAKKKGAA